MVWPAVIAAGATLASSALSLAGKRGPSERDLMHMQHDFKRKGLLEFPRAEVAGLRAAGINPLIAYGKGSPGPSAVGMPAVAPPVDKGTDAAKLFQQGLATAVDMYRAIADVDLKRRQAETESKRPGQVETEIGLSSAKTAVEYGRVGLLEAQSDLADAQTSSEKQRLRKMIVETAIAKEDLTAAERDAVLASIDIDLYESSVGEIARYLEKLGFSPRGAVAAGHMLWSLFRRSGSSKRR